MPKIAFPFITIALMIASAGFALIINGFLEGKFENEKNATLIESVAYGSVAFFVLCLLVLFIRLPFIKAKIKNALSAHFSKFVTEPTLDKATQMVSRFLAFNTFVTLIAVFVSLMSIAISFRQNVLLKAQNERVELQIVSAESQRRADMNNEIFAILKQVEDYAESDKAKREKPDYCTLLYENEQKEDEDEACQKGLLVIPNGLKGRIQTVAATAKPYYVIEPTRKNGKWDFGNDKSDEDYKPLSPQRGNLLRGLAANKVDFGKLNADFSHADLKDAQLEQSRLVEVNLYGANFTNANLWGANLSGASFFRANFTNAILREVKFGANFFLGVLLNGADISYADLKKVSLAGADLRGLMLYQLMAEAGLNDVNGEILKNYKYSIFVTELHFSHELDNAFLPEGWSVKGQRVVNGKNEWIIETPFGDYAELIKEQGEKGFLDLYAKQEALKAKKP